MFFKVFLLMIFIAKVSSTFIAEQDYYKHYNSDDYDDYEYDDAFSDEVKKPTNKTTHISEATSKTLSKETDKVTIRKQSNPALTKGDEKEMKIESVTSENTKSTSSVNKDDDITFILTDKPSKDNNVPSYEVTEDVDDIPNTMTFRPIVTNFTIKIPLNNATGVIKNISNENNNSGESKIGSNLRKNSISIFHVNAEFDDDKGNKPVIQNINIHKIPLGIFKIKGHVDKLKDDVLNHVYSTETYEETDHGYYLPNILAAPKIFFNKLREKGSLLFHKFF